MTVIKSLRHNKVMKNIYIYFVVTFLISSAGHGADLRQFVSDCAWGTIGGAVAGVVSMAVTDKPSKHTRNIAMGASLGLYAGIGFGLYRIQTESGRYNEYVQVGVAKFDDKDSYGLTLHGSF